jgi:hypothetical protein
MQGAQEMRNEEAHPAFAGYTPQMPARHMPGAFLSSPIEPNLIQEDKHDNNYPNRKR